MKKYFEIGGILIGTVIFVLIMLWLFDYFNEANNLLKRVSDLEARVEALEAQQ